ncbi:hypothetical protein F5Y03DRAFT_379733 [Xylaria venustula]|nr:hypothetical protein F5Y03DRAFT_379733 [Xylaria venustula]
MAGPPLPSPEEFSWMLAHAHDSKVPNLIAASTVALTIATISIALRLLARRLQYDSQRLVVSDWLAIIAWIFFVADCVFINLGTRYGLGRHVIFASNPRLLVITNIASEHAYVFVIALLKFSVLSLYRSIFANTRWFHILTWVMTALVGELAAQIIISTDVQCIPISLLWEPGPSGTCINYGLQALFAYIQNIIIDIVLLTMPIPLVRNLKLDRRRKLGLILVFAAGGSTCLVNIIQLVYIRELSGTADGSWNIVTPGLLSLIECMTGFLATSIATYGPFYRKVSKRSNNAYPERWYGSSFSGQHRGAESRNIAHISSSREPSDHLQENGNRIAVTDHIELVRHHREGGAWVQIED